MAKPKIRLDSEGMAAMLNSSKVDAETAKLQTSVASAVAGATAGGETIPIETRSRVASGGRLSARTARDVALAHPAGLRVEAKYGSLVRAARGIGLETKRRPSA